MADSDVRSVRFTVPGASAASVAGSQTPLAGGDLTLTASPVTLSPAQKISVTAVGNETGRTFVVTGTDINGSTQTESLAGPNATVVNGTKFFATVTSIAVDDATAGAITAGVVAGGAVTVAGPSAGGRCRVLGFHYYNAGSAGTLVLRDGSLTATTGATTTVDIAPTAAEAVDFYGNGVLFKAGCYIDLTSMPITGMTIFYEGAR